MIDLKKYHVVDLFAEIRPGILKVNGEYAHGDQARRLELRQFIYEPDKTLMHWVDMETHVGTRVELPSHCAEGGKDAASFPLSVFMGEAVELDLRYKKPREPLVPKDLIKAEVERGDLLV